MPSELEEQIQEQRVDGMAVLKKDQKFMNIDEESKISP